MLFVAPDQVEDALTGGFEFYRPLEGSFARAVFMMFLIAEAHPVVDGNGRTARIVMHAELVSAGEIRLIIPTDIEKPAGAFAERRGRPDHQNGGFSRNVTQERSLSRPVI